MIIVHHLNNSRSQRILWLLEELNLPYGIEHYRRDPTTNFAPAELKSVHPLGKSPVITDGELTLAESGAIVDYIIRRRGGGRLAPAPESRDHEAYLEWLHYAEGSAMLPLMISLYVTHLGGGSPPLNERIASEIDNNLGYVEQALAGRNYLVGDGFTGADVQMSFVGEIGRMVGRLDEFASLSEWLDRLHARPAFHRALERGGPYSFA